MKWLLIVLVCAYVFAGERFTIESGPLFWYPYQSGLDIGIKSKSGTTVSDGRYEEIDFDWGVGGKVGASFLIPKFEFSVFALWTHFNGEGDKTVHAPAGGAIFPIWNVSAADLTGATKAKGDWDLSFNTLDVGIRGTFRPRVWFEITPSLGIKNAWIDQDFHIRFSGPTIADDKLDMSSDMWGIGPRLGVDTLWKIGEVFGIYVDLAGALLWDCFDVDQKEKQGGVLLARIKDDTNVMRAVLEMSLGPFAQFYFANDQYLMRFSVAYDAQAFFSQNRFRRLGSSGTDDGNLFLQGVYARLLFSF